MLQAPTSRLEVFQSRTAFHAWLHGQDGGATVGTNKLADDPLSRFALNCGFLRVNVGSTIASLDAARVDLEPWQAAFTSSVDPDLHKYHWLSREEALAYLGPIR